MGNCSISVRRTPVISINIFFISYCPHGEFVHHKLYCSNFSSDLGGFQYPVGIYGFQLTFERLSNSYIINLRIRTWYCWNSSKDLGGFQYRGWLLEGYQTVPRKKTAVKRILIASPAETWDWKSCSHLIWNCPRLASPGNRVPIEGPLEKRPHPSSHHHDTEEFKGVPITRRDSSISYSRCNLVPVWDGRR